MIFSSVTKLLLQSVLLMGKRLSKKKEKRKPNSHQFKSTVRIRRLCVTKYFELGNCYRAGKDLRLDKNFVKYWVTKYFDEDFHCGPLGGDRRSVFPAFELPIIQLEILHFLERCPQARENDVKRFLKRITGRKMCMFLNFFLFFHFICSFVSNLLCPPSSEEAALVMESPNKVPNQQVYTRKYLLLSTISGSYPVNSCRKTQIRR